MKKYILPFLTLLIALCFYIVGKKIQEHNEPTGPTEQDLIIIKPDSVADRGWYDTIEANKSLLPGNESQKIIDSLFKNEKP